MTIFEILQTLHSQNIQVNLVDEKLKVDAPKGTMTVELMSLLKANKQELLEYLNQAESKETVIPIIDRSGHIKLSYAQQRLWFIDLMDEGSAHYNTPGVMDIKGHFDLSVAEQSFGQVIRRHEPLRTVYQNDNLEPTQFILNQFEFSITEHDFTDLDCVAQEAAITQAIKYDAESVFNLSEDLMLRVSYLKTSHQTGVLLFNMHHIAADGWSIAIMVDEFVQLYEANLSGLPNPLPPLVIQYADYAAWQRDWLNGDVLEKQLSYWADQLANLPQIHQFPLDFKRPKLQTFKGDNHHFAVGKETLKALKAIALDNQCTLFMLMHAIFSILLSRLSNGMDVVIGTPIANRLQQDLEPLIGFFVNTLVLRADCSGNPKFIDFLQQIKRTNLAAQANQDVPFEHLVDHLKPSRSTSHNALFQIMLTMDTNDKYDLNLPGVSLKPRENIHITAKFDLLLNVQEIDDGLAAHFEYNTDLFKSQTMVALAECMQCLMLSIAANTETLIAEIPVLNEQQSQHLLHELNHAQQNYPQEAFVHEIIEQQVSKTPDRTAVVCGNQNLTYAELNIRANKLAHYLINNVHASGKRVGIYLNRSLALLIAVLATIKSGKSYVALEPSLPRDRLTDVIKDADIDLILVAEDLVDDITDFQVKYQVMDDTLADVTWLAGYADQNPGLQMPLTHEVYLSYTSGSRGQPKGMAVNHQGLSNYIQHANNKYFKPHLMGSVVSSPLCFNATVTSLLTPLCHGALVELLAHSEDILKGLYERLFNSKKALLFKITPTQLDALSRLQPGSSSAQAHQLIVSGEQFSLSLLQQWKGELLPEATFVNEYGPPATVVACSMFNIPDQNTLIALSGTSVPIGYPINNFQLYVLNEGLQLQPKGYAGELYVAGKGVVKGYIKKHPLTALSFINNPYGAGSLYKSGDWVRYLENGALEFIGRLDDHVEIGGFRVETKAIEHQILLNKHVQSAFVMIHGDSNGQQELVVYLVSTGNDSTFIANAKKDLLISLPQHMIPTKWVLVPEIPLTLNGKIDRKSLPEPDTVAMNNSDDAFKAPAGVYEPALAQIWSDLLNIPVEKINRQDNFFELGGHSLSVVRLIAVMRNHFSVELTVRNVFECPQIFSLASLIGDSTSVKRPVVIKTKRKTNQLETSYAQQRLWFIDQMDGGSIHYNIPGAIEIEGDFEVKIAELAFRDIIQRHESLRTVFIEGANGPMQVIQNDFDFSLEHINISHLAHDQQQLAIQQAISKDAETTFKLNQDLMLRISYLQTNDQTGVLLFNMHHIASDGWSIGVLVHEFVELYRSTLTGKPSKLPPLDIQYADYAHWQRHEFSETVSEQQLQYWQHQLADLPHVHQLPLDFERPKFQTFNGARHQFELSKLVSDRLKDIGLNNQATLFMVIHAAFSILLSRYSNTHDIVIGSPVANRLQQELEYLIGFFVNTLVLRVDCSNNPLFVDLLAEIKQINLDAQANQDVPFEHLVDRLNPHRNTSYNALFQILLSMDINQEHELSLPNANLSILANEQVSAKFDLSLFVTDGDKLAFVFEYNTDLFTAETVERLASGLKLLLVAVANNPNQGIDTLPILSDAETNYLTLELNDTKMVYPTKLCVHELFEKQVTDTPDRIAVRCKEQSMNYATLNSRANQLAHYLISQGVKPDDFVGLCVERSVEMMIGLLAILKAGGAYLPLDPSYPKERLEHMLVDSQVSLLLTQQHVHDELSFTQQKVICIEDEDLLVDHSEENIPTQSINLSSSNLAYIIYTSGSTGKPKGAAVEHRNETNLLFWYIKEYGLNKSDKVLILSAIGFDLTQKNMFAPLLCGASVQFATARFYDVNTITEFIKNQQITITNCAPSVFYPLVEHQHDIDKLSSLRCVLFGGEKIVFDRLNQWLTKTTDDFQLINMYGPTECTDISCAYSIPVKQKNSSAPIGKPNDNVKLYVLNDQQQLAPYGTSGELCVGGLGVSRGYLNQAKLTAEKFIKNPFSTDSSEKIYRTGDSVRWNQQAQLDFIGRIDSQIKIRGFRVELGEIEFTINEIPEIKQSVVIHNASNQTLHAFLVPSSHAPIDTVKLRLILKKSLPAHMIPVDFVELNELPLTTHGKIDKQALSGQVMVETELNIIKPQGEIEQQLVSMWSDLLQMDAKDLSIDHNFFELGGHSLLLTTMLHRVTEELGSQLNVKDIYHQPTIEAVARLVATNSSSAVHVLEKQDSNKTQPLSYGQYRIWFIEQLKENSNEHNLAVAAKIKGDFKVDVLEKAMNAIISQHTALRTCIEVLDNQPMQVIADSYVHRIELIDLTHLPQSLKEGEVAKLTRNQDTQVFDLSQLPLFAVLLLQVEADEYILHFNQHHIISDGWSQQLFYNQLMTVYQSIIDHQQGDMHDEQPFNYADYAVWQQQWLTSDDAQQQRQFWQTYLKDSKEQFYLPTQRPEGTLDGQQNMLQAHIDSGTRNALKTMAHSHKGSLFNVLHSAFAVLLARLSGELDFNIGIPITGRHIYGTQNMLGMFLNTLPVRHKINLTDDFKSILLEQIHNIEQVLSHQDIPLEQIFEATDCERNIDSTPLFQILFNMLSVPESTINEGNFNFKMMMQEPAEIENKFNLTLYLKDSTEGINIYCHYNSSTFSQQHISVLLDQYKTLLEQIVFDANKSCLDYSLNQGSAKIEYDKPLIDDAQQPIEEVTVRFRQHVKTQPDAIAIRDEYHDWSYQNLLSYSYGLALKLRSQGVKQGDVITLMAARQANMVAAILATLQLGAAYSVVTPDTPVSRILQHIDIVSNPVMLMCESEGRYQPALLKTIDQKTTRLHLANQPNHYPSTPVTFVPEINSPESVACITFTSGSSGVPKAVQGTHLGLCGYLNWLPTAVGFNSEDHFGMLSGLAHDPLQRDIFGALSSGATLIIPSTAQFTAYQFSSWIQDQQISILHLTPAMAEIICMEPHADLTSLKTVFLTGETLRRDTAESLLRLNPELRILNCFGTTETQRAATYFAVDELDKLGSVVPVAMSTPDTRIRLVNAHDSNCGLGEVGLICTESSRIAKGYLNDQALTAQRFMDLTGGIRRYNTGDLGVCLDGKQIKYLGRGDAQINIRGFRVELGEIEYQITRYEPIKSCTVIVHNEAHIIAYVTTDQAISEQELVKNLTAYLTEHLPEYMRPTAVILIDQIPLTANKKIDHHALPDPHQHMQAKVYIAPNGSTEIKLVQIWAMLLKLDSEQISSAANFFELGGHSLLLLKLLSEIRDEFKQQVNLKFLFECEDLSTLASLIDSISKQSSLTESLAHATNDDIDEVEL